MYNQEPKCMKRITEIEYANSLSHYILGVPEQRQPFIGLDARSGSYTLQMFPLGYFNYSDLGFAFRVDHDREVRYYKYGSSENWEKLENNFVNQFAGDFS